jgi:hypothetical protein
MMPIACPEKAAFGTVWKEDNSQNGLQPVVTKKVGFFDHIPIRISLGGHSEPKETEPKSGSDSPSRGLHRHGFLKNRHSYFTNPLICSRIAGMIPLTCPEKAAFGTVWTEDNSQNGLQYAGRKDTGDWGQIPIRMEKVCRGPGFRAGRKNYEQDNNPMENHI